MLETYKWFATSLLILGFGLFSAGIEYGWYIQITGGVFWLVAAVVMKDKPLIATNGFMTAAGVLGKILG